jgi:hypothetical protein
MPAMKYWEIVADKLDSGPPNAKKEPLTAAAVFGHWLVPNCWQQQRLGEDVHNTIGVTAVSPLAERVELPLPADYASSRNRCEISGFKMWQFHWPALECGGWET